MSSDWFHQQQQHTQEKNFLDFKKKTLKDIDTKPPI